MKIIFYNVTNEIQHFICKFMQLQDRWKLHRVKIIACLNLKVFVHFLTNERKTLMLTKPKF